MYVVRDKWLPEALRVGVPYGTFWHLTPRTIRPFFEAYSKRQEEQYELIDYAAWRNGLYAVMARIATPALGKGHDYPQKPLLMQEKEQERQEEHKPESKCETDVSAAAGFAALALAFNQQFRKGEEQKHGDGN